MKPNLEIVPRAPDASWSMLNRRLDEVIPFQWHHHPEFELTLTLNSIGQRFIGDHTGDYADNDLVLVGPNLPHTWVSRAKIDDGKPHVALVLWFHPDWIARMAADAVEFKGIEAMLVRGERGLRFPRDTAAMLRAEIEAIFDLPPRRRLLSLLAILGYLAEEKHAEPLAAVPATKPAVGETRERIDRVLAHMHMHYARDLSLEELADVAALSVSGVHRLVRRHTGSSISDYLMRLRIGEACARLSSTNDPVERIAEHIGYNTIANFHRQFKALKGMQPLKYRKLFR